MFRQVGPGPDGIVNPKTDTFYGYFVDEGVALMFVVLFAATALAHLAQSIFYRVWWLAPSLALCAIGEVLGWVGRYWSARNYQDLTPYLMQIVCTIIAPSFMTAGLFFTLGTIVNRAGPQYCRFRPKTFSIVFIGFDFFSLFVQAAGGAIASSAFEKGKSSTKGSHVMVLGIIIQLIAMTLYVAVAAEFFTRYYLDKPFRAPATHHSSSTSAIRPRVSRNITQILIGMIIATSLLFIRCIYRTAELLDGFRGPIQTNQTLFDVLDPTPILLGLVALNVFNPGRLLFPRGRGKQNPDMVEMT